MLSILKWVRERKRKPTQLDRIERQNEYIIMKLSELAAALAAIEAKLDEAGTEIVDLIKKLQDQLGDVDIPEAASATLAALLAKGTALADIVPNA